MLALTSHVVIFNGAFYVVAMTVVPIYFVALLLPGGVLFKYWGWASKKFEVYARAHPSQRKRPSPPDELHSSGHNLAFAFFFAPVILFLLAFAEIEIGGAWILHYRNPSASEAMVIFWLFILNSLLVATSVLLDMNFDLLKRSRRYCTKCKVILEQGAKFCGNCGLGIKDLRDLKCTRCEALVRAKDLFYSSCGESLGLQN